MMKHSLLALGIAAVLSGCGGSDSKDSAPVTGGGGGDTGGSTTEISGAALAPGGNIAQFRTESAFQVVMNFLVSPAAAAITGLSPVADATVELIRVDNSGDQVGDVLDTATTSDTGEYSLELPDGEELGADLLVVISGVGTAQMRAQVVSEQVDISPVSEYVLQKFIANGSDLKTLTPESVVQINSQVNDLNLDAGTDLTALLAQLDEQAGEFVNEAIEVVIAPAGDAGSVAGNYRNLAVQWGFEHGDHSQWSRFVVDTWVTDMSFADGGDNIVTIAINEEQSAEAQLVTDGTEPTADHQIWYSNETETVGETFDGTLSASGVVSIQGEVEEEIDGDFGEITLPSVYPFHKLLNSNLFVLPARNSSTYYNAVDSNNDGTVDQIDTTEAVGKEIYRGFEFLSKKPTAATNADLDGDFGRIYIGTTVLDTGYTEIEVEHSVLSFDGVGLLDAGEASRHTMVRGVDGNVSFVADVADAENDLVYGLNSDGSFSTIGGGDPGNDFANDTFDFLSMSNFEVEDDEFAGGSYAEVHHALTLAVKLPNDLLTLDERVYKVRAVQTIFVGSAMVLNEVRMDSRLTMTSATTASLDASATRVSLANKHSADIVIESETLNELPVTVALESNGEVTFVVDGPNGDTTYNGFMNHDGSMGLMQTRYTPDGGQAIGVGLAVLVEVNP